MAGHCKISVVDRAVGLGCVGVVVVMLLAIGCRKDGGDDTTADLTQSGKSEPRGGAVDRAPGATAGTHDEVKRNKGTVRDSSEGSTKSEEIKSYGKIIEFDKEWYLRLLHKEAQNKEHGGVEYRGDGAVVEYSMRANANTVIGQYGAERWTLRCDTEIVGISKYGVVLTLGGEAIKVDRHTGAMREAIRDFVEIIKAFDDLQSLVIAKQFTEARRLLDPSVELITDNVLREEGPLCAQAFVYWGERGMNRIKGVSINTDEGELRVAVTTSWSVFVFALRAKQWRVIQANLSAEI
jgi:hypothetical protein